MSFPLIGFGFIIGAVALSRRSRRGGLGSFASTHPESNTSESFDAVERAASALYEPVDEPRVGRSDLVWDNPSYKPSCSAFTSEALEALNSAKLAEDNGEPQAYSAKVLAVQAWALSQIECGDDEAPAWAVEQAERPL